MLVTGIFSFSHYVLFEANFNSLVILILSSVNAFNLEESEILSFGEELTHLCVYNNFMTDPNFKLHRNLCQNL